MDTRPVRAIPAARVYEDFQPISEWVREEGSDSVLINLPGFTKEQLKVQIYEKNNLKISGERSLGENKWLRFSNDIRVPLDCNSRGIKANLENGILYVKMPKITTQSDPKVQPKPVLKASNDQADPNFQPKPILKAPTFEKTPSQPASQRPLDGAPPKAPSFASAETQIKGKGSEQVIAKTVAQKAPEEEKEKEKEKQLSTETNGKVSERANAKDVAQKAPEKKEMSGGSAVTGSVANGEKLNDQSVHNPKTKDGGTENVTGCDQCKMEESKQFARGLFMRLKKPRKMTVYKVMAVTMVVAIGVYLSYRLVVPEEEQN